MKQLTVLTIYFSSLIYIICNEACVIHQDVMNCSYLNLTDCPLKNNSVKTLILDGNLLKNFTSSNCLQWTNIENLFIRNNNLINISNLENFTNLILLDLSINKLKNLSIIVRSSLNTINASYNLIERVNLQLPKPASLSNLYLGNNKINKSNLNNLINDLHNSPLEILDLSYNKIDSIPIEFMTLDSQIELLINFTGNQLSTIYFSSFLQKSKILNFDFSFNNMSSFSINNNMNIHKINFSNNDLSNIDGNSLNYFNVIEYFDLSYNPLNCSCNVSEKFIEWMKDHKDIIRHQHQTQCKSENVPIFDIKCPVITSTIQPTTSTTVKPLTSSTKSSLTTTKNQSTSRPVFNNSLKIVLATIIPIVIIILIIFTLYWIFHKNQGYSELVKSKCLSCCSNCYPSISFNYRNLSSCNLPPNLFGSDENIDSTGSLLVICSSKDSKWILKDIMTEISIGHRIIDSKVPRVPFFEFVLIVVNGDHCLKDYTFISNVEKALQMKDESEIRLLISTMPNFSKLIVENPLTSYIRDMMHENVYFKYDENSPLTCLEGLKLWLNFNV